MKSKITALIIGLCITTGSVIAQDWEYGLFIGPAQYQGDLSQSQVTWKYTRPQGGAFARYNLNPRICFKGGINYGNVKGDDKGSGNKWSQDGKTPLDFKASGWKYGSTITSSKEDDSRYDRRKRNLNFTSNILEVTAQVEWNIFRFIPGSRRYRWTPYLLAGFSVFRFNPKTDLNGTTYKLRNYITELDKVGPNGTVKKYSLISFAIPTGIGVKYNLGSLWSVGFEMAGRKTFTDWLDDTHANWPGTAITAGSTDQLLSDRSGVVINPATGKTYPGDMWLNDIPNVQQVNRGDPKDKDTYIFTGFTISKTIRPYGCTNF